MERDRGKSKTAGACVSERKRMRECNFGTIMLVDVSQQGIAEAASTAVTCPAPYYVQIESFPPDRHGLS